MFERSIRVGGIVAAVALLSAGTAGPASATNGYLSICIGAYNCGMGGAGVALPTDSSNAGLNPALMARLGGEAFLSPAFFHPVRTMDVRGNTGVNISGKQTSRVENFVEGAAGLNFAPTAAVTLGASLYGSGGMMTKYDRSRTAAGAGGNYDNEVRYRLGNLVPALTWKPDNSSAYGVGLIIGYSDFKTNFATLPSFAQTRGRNEVDSAYGAGVRIGGLWDFGSAISAGATVASPVWFETFEKYRDVFLGPLNTPANGTIGIAWHATEDLDIVADVRYIAWQTVRAIGQAPGEGGFGWKNTPVFMLGGQYRADGCAPATITAPRRSPITTCSPTPCFRRSPNIM
ncbi:MAG: hypothetical protein HY057_14260 [Rhodospirillales bacterium]|nr:hypothetical protein [Rhodospirillales bacterium]